ncbi:MAG: methylenetetrahydrofolate reductase, partial [Oscillospiraceae bacterium]|nr:methylenetetrahydrofolate reductase [Oscillospiraceae bacterium]
MRVTEIMKERMSFSFEVFPPKTDEGVSKLHGVLEELYAFKPDFISCTYGAGGSNAGRNLEVVSTIAASPNDTVSVTHFTCVGNTFDGIKKQIDDYLAAGVDHVLALRGDLPEGWEGTRGDFDYAT